MATARRTWASPLSAIGSAGLLCSLWLPWYTIRIPASVLDSVQQLAPQLGILGPFVSREAQAARSLGALHLTAWQALTQIDVALAIAAVLAGGLALLASAGRASGTGRLIGSAAGVALALTAYRILVPPGPNGVLHPAVGAYLCLACAAATALTGALGHAAEEGEPDWTAPASAWAPASDGGAERPLPGSTSGSVAPPTQ
jgi:hypothetical protein